MEFIESLERMMLADKFRRYHPGAEVPKKGHYKEWLLSLFNYQTIIYFLASAHGKSSRNVVVVVVAAVVVAMVVVVVVGGYSSADFNGL